jgi:hypothetical protein
MVMMLAVLAMLIGRSADPNTWRWLTGEANVKGPNAGDGAAPAKVAAQKAPPEPEIIEPGPTDLDLDEQVAVVEQFEAVSDGTTLPGREEMPAYWRLF